MSLSKMEMWVVAGAVCGRGRSDRKNVKLSISGDRAPLGLRAGRPGYKAQLVPSLKDAPSPSLPLFGLTFCSCNTREAQSPVIFITPSQ